MPGAVVRASARCPELTRHHMEIRGLGLINVQDLFGVASTRTSKRVELVVQLERWEHGREYDRLGLDDEFYETLGARIPMIRMPVAPGPQRRDPRGGRGAQPAAARRAAITPRAGCVDAARTSSSSLGAAPSASPTSSGRRGSADAREAPRGAARGAHRRHARGSSC